MTHDVNLLAIISDRIKKCSNEVSDWSTRETLTVESTNRGYAM